MTQRSLRRSEGAVAAPVAGDIAYTFSPSAERIRYQGLPPELARVEKRGPVMGPAPYASSCWRARRGTASR
jgi:hypothetical protein